MRPSPQTRRQALAAAAAALTAAVTAVVGAACSPDTSQSDPAPTTARSTPGSATPARPTSAAPSSASPLRLPRPDDVDGDDPTAVSRAALTAMWSVDSATDRRADDVYRRARPYLTSGYYAALTGRTASSPWSPDWWAHRAYTHLTLTTSRPVGDVEPDTPYTAHREWDLTIHPIGRDGWRGAPLRLTAFTTLEKPTPEHPWKVNHVGTGTR